MIVTPEDIISYTAAGIEIAIKCAELRKQGYEMMVVPSRGAHPFIKSAREFHCRCLSLMDRSRVGSGSIFANYSRSNLQTALRNPLYLPFTSDFGANAESGLSSKTIRNFWANVTKSIVENNYKSPSYKFFRYVRDDVVKIGHHSYAEDWFTSKKFIYIDTAISGRAVVEISDAFENLGMTEIQYIFIIDENGKKLTENYKSKISKLHQAGRAHLIYVDRLFTEDQGPAISGIWSVVLPELMEVAREEIPSFQDAVGAGLYYWEVQSRATDVFKADSTKEGLPDNTLLTSAISQIDVLLFTGTRLIPSRQDFARYVEIFEDGAGDKIRKYYPEDKDPFNTINVLIEGYNEHIGDAKNALGRALFHPDTTKEIAEDLIKRQSTVDVMVDISSSHCLRANMSKDQAFKIIKDFKADGLQ
ncbi:hypothetical protein [Acetobacter fabarum]|uniref:hypothetical protein n=1 Tax=Acetobacter fabarum TaxID=483199 RepID=UPI0039E9433E